MKGNPYSYISSSCSDMKTIVDHFELSAFMKLNEHLDDVLRTMGVHNKVRCGSIVRLGLDNKSYMVLTKVIANGNHFMHEEPWSEFPSDHFKAKVLLATGGA